MPIRLADRKCGSAVRDCDGLDNYALTLLQAQADHELQLANVSLGATASNLDEDDYSGRLVE